MKHIMSRFEMSPAPSRWLPLAVAALMACQMDVAHADDRAEIGRAHV